MPKHCIFTDPLLIISYVQSALLILFFHNKLLFYNDIELIKPLSFFFRRLQAMLCRLHNRSFWAMPLKTDEGDQPFNIIENKTNSITDIFFLKYCLDLKLLHLSFWKFFSWIFTKRNFLSTLNGLFQKNLRSVRFRVSWE